MPLTESPVRSGTLWTRARLQSVLVVCDLHAKREGQSGQLGIPVGAESITWAYLGAQLLIAVPPPGTPIPEWLGPVVRLAREKAATLILFSEKEDPLVGLLPVYPYPLSDAQSRREKPVRMGDSQKKG